jgi:hypothetical protein
MPDEAQCRCCRKPVPLGKLACPPHWKMLPSALRSDILKTYGGPQRDLLRYADHIREADAFWQSRNIWKPARPSPGQGSLFE